MGAIEQFIIDALLTHSLNLSRLSAELRNQILALLTAMAKELSARLAVENLTDFGRQRLNALLRESNVIIATHYDQAMTTMQHSLAELAKLEAKYTAKVLTEAFKAKLGIGLPPDTHLEKIAGNTLFQGAASKDWWARQSQDTQFRFANAVRQGAAQGETTSQIVARVVGKQGEPGVIEISRKHAYALVQTSVQAVANAARLETFQKNADVIDCLVWLSTLDSHTCLVCAARDQLQYSLDDQKPIKHDLPWDGGPGAIHFACRCVVSTQTKSFAELGIDIPEDVGTRASGGGQVAGDLKFKDWLAGKDATFRREYLGPGRAELYESGKITLNDLMDQRGNPLTLEQLRQKYK